MSKALGEDLGELRSRPGTLKDLEALGDGAQAELIDSVLCERPTSSFEPGVVVNHMIGATVASDVLGRGGPLGWAIASVDWIVGHEVFLPHLSGWRQSKLRHQDPKGRVTVVPDWVLEVLSPGTTMHDLITKREAYARLGVRYRWYVYPKTRVLQTFELRRGQWIETGAFIDDDVVRTAPFAEVGIPLASWWDLPAPTATKRKLPRMGKRS